MFVEQQIQAVSETLCTAPALQSVIAEAKPGGKRIGLFLCHGGGPGKSLDKLKALLSGNTIAGAIDLVNPANQDKAALKQGIEGWAKSLTDSR